MDHLQRIAEEFTRQAQSFEAWAQQADDQVASRFRTALGEAGTGHLLDVACGPGVVTAAIARSAASVIGLDATEQMLEKARARCAQAGLSNVEFKRGDAENLPFGEARFDGLVTRFAVHHFANPDRAFNEMFRVLSPGGTAVIVDVVSSEDADASNLHNAIERLRDPSHVRMLSKLELEAAMQRAGFERIVCVTWDQPREFEEWMRIVNDPDRVGPLRVVVRALAAAGLEAGIGLSLRNDRIVFFHCHCLLTGVKPLTDGTRHKGSQTK